ncbi:hypothetical protein VNI00_018524 [Paramarasmius palmivorus]|uniref:Uncharacterized protein n=1 Tax=Paramarasmius palmivorus TaxID=297713 RepID=A0AAW0AX13_9AGAR
MRFFTLFYKKGARTGERAATKYRGARKSHLHLTGPGPWEQTLRVLNNEDIRSYRDPAAVRQGPGRQGTNEEDDAEEREMGRPLKDVEDNAPVEARNLLVVDRTEWNHWTTYGTGETRKGYSWIWHAGGKIDLEDGTDENDNEILRSEWCKSRARAKRATEEVLLLREEMRRSLAYLEWKAADWDKHAETRTFGSSSDWEGRRAFATTQAALQRNLKWKFECLWAKAFEDGRMEEVAQKVAEVAERVRREAELIAKAGEEAAAEDAAEKDDDEEAEAGEEEEHCDRVQRDDAEQDWYSDDEETRNYSDDEEARSIAFQPGNENDASEYDNDGYSEDEEAQKYWDDDTRNTTFQPQNDEDDASEYDSNIDWDCDL